MPDRVSHHVVIGKAEWGDPQHFHLLLAIHHPSFPSHLLSALCFFFHRILSPHQSDLLLPSSSAALTMPGDDDPIQNRPAAPSAPDSRRWPDDENPFVAFRRFADEQLSSMLQSVMGIPSMSSRPSPDHWAVFDDDARFRKRDNSESKGDDHAAADNSDHPFHHNNRHPSRSWTEWEDQWHVDHPRRRRTDQDFFDSFFDSPFSSRFLHPHHHPMFSGFASNTSTWPLTYLMFSPYSPLHLERQDYYQSHHDRGVFSSLMSSLSLSSDCDPAESHWREAFEDLIRLENGKPMLDHDSSAVVKRETTRDWLYGLVKRGSVGDQWKISELGKNDWSSPMAISQFHFKDDDCETPKDRIVEEKTEALTELDMFDRFFEDAAARESKAFADAFESPILRFLLEERQRSRDTPSDTENWFERVSNNSIPDAVPEKQQPAPETQAIVPSRAEPTAEKPTVISTMTRTERIRLPNGSTQKKTVWTKKFSDGREESNESVEIMNPPQSQDSSNQDRPTSDQKNSGWFWKD
ncbi:hypothetical protein BO94DRAFT_82470 [Aspergillus sclerotioniger CBS 115572]|uniref:Uncharacterized protein n=1 Tax=Aspergillus sclerotioniger CBS 115572 TaxID=1450535 RepID=A0A317WL55_9EURO|nr:hypothetical protein BO94DRAFT_82470 [Aspergillus sclerotioniger CBS 115572]PWY86441.1 hypothetical protein BO94DRAFT_82470 [Aspergillus sclerotioniger CBS 115572]